MSSEEKIEAKAKAEPTAKEELKDAHNNTEDTKVSTPVAAEAETEADKELVTSESKLSTSNDDEKKEEQSSSNDDNNNISSSSTETSHRKWVLWFDNPRFAEEGAPWRDNLKQCGTINTGESFWRVYNNVKPITQLPLNSNYHIFKEGVEPMWEDVENINGGKFVLTVPKKETRAGKLEDWWLCTLLAIVGETMDVSGNVICGAVLSTRKAQDRIALWLNTDKRDVCMKIGEKWKKAMELEDHRKMTVKYQLHKEAAAAGHSFKNDIKFEV